MTLYGADDNDRPISVPVAAGLRPWIGQESGMKIAYTRALPLGSCYRPPAPDAEPGPLRAAW
jgi:hypothetical protein